MPNPRQDYPIGDLDLGQMVQVTKMPALGVQGVADLIWLFGAEGRLFISSDADQNDTVTGQTSFADTTPTFLLDVPLDTTAIPMFLNLSQTGTVAGGAVDVLVELDIKKRYSTGGTSEKVVGFVPGIQNKCALYSTATAFAGYGVSLWRATIGQDVSPAEGAVQGPFWKPEAPYFLNGPAALNIYTYAGTTGPTWFWSFGWLEIETRRLRNIFLRMDAR